MRSQKEIFSTVDSNESRRSSSSESSGQNSTEALITPTTDSSFEQDEMGLFGEQRSPIEPKSFLPDLPENSGKELGNLGGEGMSDDDLLFAQYLTDFDER